MRLAIIGSTGRSTVDHQQWNENTFEAAIASIQYLLEQVWKISPEHVTLVSGGSAWAQHVAVGLFLRQHIAASIVEGDPLPSVSISDVPVFAGLELHFPCGWDGRTGKFSEETWQGRQLNLRHDVCSSSLHHSTHLDLRSVRAFPGCRFIVHPGKFQTRNHSLVSTCTHLVSFQWDHEIPDPSVLTDAVVYSSSLWKFASHTDRISISIRDLLGPYEPRWTAFRRLLPPPEPPSTPNSKRKSILSRKRKRAPDPTGPTPPSHISFSIWPPLTTTF